MLHSRRALVTLAAALVFASPLGSATGAPQSDGGDDKPSLSLRLTPSVGFTPLRVRVAVDIQGGPNDYQEFYCPTVEWDWGNGTMSERSGDCGPYEAGKSTIERRFSNEHQFRQAGTYKVVFRLKQGDRVVGSSSGTVRVQAGAGGRF